MFNAIEVRGLRKAYGGRDVVRGIDLTVAPGEVVAFLGPNGAGKTTTVEILEGFRKADAGEIRVLGEDPATAGSGWRDRIGVVLQESAPEGGLTVRDTLGLYAGCYSNPRPIEATLARVGLGDQIDQRADKLSGGQLRRLDVALALIGNPELVFLDEPTTGFDPSARRAAWDLVDSLRELGVAVLLTTHYMEEAERLADRIVVIRDGVIVAEDTPGRLGGRDTVTQLVYAIDGERVQVPTHDINADLRRLLDEGVDLSGLEIHRPTLEDVYLELTA